jgi:hypothetical protein
MDDDRLAGAKAAGMKQAAAIRIKVGHMVEHSGAVTDPMPESGWEAPGAMDLTREQLAFLTDLRRGTRRATSAQDASVIGPLIRANLVRWDDDPSAAAGRRKPPGSTFTLTPLGETCLAEHEAQGHLP